MSIYTLEKNLQTSHTKCAPLSTL